MCFWNSFSSSPCQTHSQDSRDKNVIQKDETRNPDHIAFPSNQADHSASRDNVMNANHISRCSANRLQRNNPDGIGTNSLSDPKLEK